MGRKPNHIIRYFFDRGPKLPDSSNRYQQTCRRCGEKFEKGRNEALIRHIQRACPGVTAHERERFLVDLNWNQTRPAARTKASTHASAPESTTRNAELSGLNALAEASALNNDHPSHGPEPGGHNQHNHGFGRSTSITYAGTPASSADLQLAALRALIPGRDGSAFYADGNADEAIIDYDRGEGPAEETGFSNEGRPSPRRDSSPGQRDGFANYIAVPGMELTASAPRRSQDFVENDIMTHLVDPAIQNQQPPAVGQTRVLEPPNMDALHGSHGAPKNLQQQGTVANGNAEALISDATVPETHTFQNQDVLAASSKPRFQIWSPHGLHPSSQKKVRGAFAPERWTAVREVRKKGACLRCRMLKKSCDSGDPCNECAKLENARTWKGRCLRTRLSQALSLFSSGLFATVERGVFKSSTSGGTESALPQDGRLEVCYFPLSGLAMTFSCSRVTERLSQFLLHVDGDASEPYNSSSLVKFSQYGSRVLAQHLQSGHSDPIFRFQSRLMDETLRMATTMNNRTLIARTLDLFFTTQMLIMAPSELVAVHEPRLVSNSTPVVLSQHAPERGENLQLIYAQLRRKLERTCDVHFKAVMTEVEKSLIQRKQADNFETLLATIITLRCLEQVCYMYKGFDHLTALDKSEAESMERRDVLYAGENSRWPLEKLPSHYWQQGERFSDLLVSMLTLRKVPPKFNVIDGRLRADETESEVVRDYFDSIDLGMGMLQRAKAKLCEEVDEKQWELRWIGKLFEK